MTNDIFTHEETVRLIRFIEAIGGGYPLIGVSTAGGLAKVLWQYERNDIVIHCTGEKFNLCRKLPINKALHINMPSLEDAFHLIHTVEHQRQAMNAAPFVRFGIVPTREGFRC